MKATVWEIWQKIQRLTQKQRKAVLAVINELLRMKRSNNDDR